MARKKAQHVNHRKRNSSSPERVNKREKDFCPRLQLTTTKGLWILLCPPHLLLHDQERPRNMLPDPRTAAS
ncbi:hypothetical protein TNIN_154411 [Trichonephila inaurata madagascariensis]|uniref:Uncharacterized protein n=1 Tax=Trichonephila inaurata madagascariensis TaxID=2747483 RepID=A0A8X6X276_9ARAC|nr:hypothetical protein TNIN_154411 [Trichonephila inaurata madagascariensis]